MTEKELEKEILKLKALRQERKKLYIEPLTKQIKAKQNLLSVRKHRKKNKI